MAVKIKELVDKFNLEILVQGEDNIEIDTSDLNRPGLQLSGFYNYFANERIQIIGRAEWSFLDDMQVEIRRKRLKKFMSFETPCIILTRNLEPHEELLEYAKKNKRWVLRSDMISTKFINKLSNLLAENLAPETRIHGVLVDVYGIGIVITGESGIGKSETALELIKRGHRLVADDAVDIKAIDGVLKGSSPSITSGMLEVRGMGIIDVPALYGLSSVIHSKTIALIIHFEHWKDDGNYDRLGIDKEYIDILNVPARRLRIPVRPGRNIAVIIEAAAANYRYNLISKTSPVDIIEQRMDAASDEFL
ncbi:HPr(Ser) kinase/phosphatase [Clostridium hydrogeniformans]|uniref:HPr(Ser) kinase/phosphatase n=1 Tax=Clostridium hydrogeniformans TaxID=349933 RepID=UPI0004866C5E|nr:HPr(Ser) kinase/phosphatase [Clostridium hydrogeniformans]